MHIKTIYEEIPVTKQGLIIYRDCIKEIRKPVVRELNKLDKILEICNVKLKNMGVK